MSAPPTEVPDEAYDYVGQDDEDDDEDDEADFVPGVEEEEEDYDDDAVVPLMDGHLFLDTKDCKLLHFQGSGFHLTASKLPDANLLGSEKPSEKTYSVRMEGSCDMETPANGKAATHRRFDLTWTIQKTASPGQAPARLKGDPDDDDDDDDCKEAGDTKLPPFSYSVFGHQVESSGSDLWEFQGSYPPGDGKRVSLVCQVRMVASQPAVVAVAAKPAAAAAAHRVDDEDDDEEGDAADDEVDMEELIALHQDAGLPVDALRKRYRGGDGEQDGKKRVKEAPVVNHDDDDEDDDDDDDDYGF